jgi:hypothetical protein
MVFSYSFLPSIASPPEAKDLIKAPLSLVSSSPSISLLIIILAFFLYQQPNLKPLLVLNLNFYQV